MLAPIVLVLVSIIIGAIFHLNLDYDFRRVSNFTVKFNTTVNECEYKNLTSSLFEIVEDNGFDNFRIERIGSGAQNGLFVKIVNDDADLDDKIEDLKVVIEEKLLSQTDDIESSIVVTTSETGFSLPKNVLKTTLISSLSVVAIVAFVFLYKWIRYNLISGCSLALTIAIEIATLFAGMVTFRIPFNEYFVLPFIAMILTTIINSTIIDNYIKPTLNSEAYAKTSNSDRVEEATTKTFVHIIIYNALIVLGLIPVMIVSTPSLIYLCIAILLGLVVSVLGSMFVNTSLWSFWYKREKDKVLKRRIKAEEDRIEKKKSGKKAEDEKIVV